MTTILVVEDEPKIGALLRDYLQHAGMSVTVIGDGDEASTWLKANACDLAIFDLMLPGKDGLSLCREVRQRSTLPVLLLTARVDDIDRITGLDAGADDYVCKPFNPQEVVARVKAILRRTTQSDATTDVIEFGSLRIDVAQHRCDVVGNRVDLTPVEFQLLLAMANAPKRVFPRDDLIRVAYPDDRVVSSRTIDSHIKNLRRKLSAGSGEQVDGGDGKTRTPADASSADFIRSVYGVGYVFEPPASEPRF